MALAAVESASADALPPLTATPSEWKQGRRAELAVFIVMPRKGSRFSHLRKANQERKEAKEAADKAEKEGGEAGVAAGSQQLSSKRRSRAAEAAIALVPAHARGPH